jgi:hypothetical protein
MAVGQPISIFNVPTSSLASQLPQGFRTGSGFVARHITCGSELARESGGSGSDDAG